MSVVFLDLDGVINCCECDKENFIKAGYGEKDYYNFASPWAVDRVITICKETDSYIVINGSLGRKLWEQMIDESEYDSKYWTDYICPNGNDIFTEILTCDIGIDGYAFDVRIDCNKLESVARYLYNHPEVDNFIIIEDGMIVTDEYINEVLTRHPEYADVLSKITPEHQIDTNKERNNLHSPVWGLDNTRMREAIEKLNQNREIDIDRIL